MISNKRRRFRCNSVALIFAVAMLAWSTAADEGFSGNMDARILATGGGRVMLLAQDGTVLWEHKAGNIHDAWYLPNGNVIFADGNIKEVTPDKKVVFEYVPQEQKGGGAFSVQRLANGNTVIGENSSGKIVEVDPAGKVIVSFQSKFENPEAHHNHLRMVRKTSAGTYLVCHASNNVVREYNATGEIVWELKTKGLAFAGVRLANGNTVVSTLNQVTEYDVDGKQVWEFAVSDLPDLHIQNMTGFHILPSGNLVIGCYRGYDKESGSGVGMFEITRAKVLVWKYAAPNGPDHSNMGVQKLVDGAQPPLR